jgi:hypothetical protein
MNVLRRKLIEQSIIEVLRDPRAHPPSITLRSLREWVAASAGDCSAAELAAAVQALRYQGKLHWDRFELAPSMIETSGAPVPEREGGGDGTPARAVGQTPPSSVSSRQREETPQSVGCDEGAGGEGKPILDDAGPDDPEDDYPGNVNDATGDRRRRRGWGANPGAGFVSRKGLHQAGVHAAATRAGAKPLPAPAHEPEVARQVREEVNEQAARRNRAKSTGTVRVPLELRDRFKLDDLTGSEAIGCMLTEDPKAVMRAVERRHPGLWRRCILLARATGKSPMEALYRALERGLDDIEAAMPAQADA